MGTEGLLVANLIANYVTSFVIFGILKFKKYFGKFDKHLMKEMLKYSIPLVPNTISWSIISMSDRILLTKIVGAHENGIYSMACKFPNIVNVIYMYFATAWKDAVARTVKRKDRNRFINGVYQDVTKILFCLMLCIISAMPFAFPIFINSAYDEAYIYIPIIMISMYFVCASNFFGGIFEGFKFTKTMGRSTMIGSVINLVIDLLLITHLHVYAACISTLVANIVIYYYRKYKIKKLCKIKDLRLRGPIIVFCFVTLTYYLKYMFNMPEVLYWLISSLVFVMCILYTISSNKKFVDIGIEKLKTQFNKLKKK